MSAPELNKKISVSIAALVAAGTLIFSLGITWGNLSRLDGEIQNVKTFSQAEIDGLRSDMNREILLIREENTKEHKRINEDILEVKEAGLTRQKWMTERAEEGVKHHEEKYHNNR